MDSGYERIATTTHRGGWQRTNTGYDFTGHPLKARILHSDPTVGDMTERYTYSYDAWGRPLTVTHQLDAISPVVLHNYAYDAVGRVESDSRNGDADLNTNKEKTGNLCRTESFYVKAQNHMVESSFKDHHIVIKHYESRWSAIAVEDQV